MKNRSFEVGDEIISIQDHSRKLVLKGDVFTVKGFTRNPCCGSTIVDVGVKSPNPKTTCYTCGCSYDKPGGGYWFAAYIFRKVQKKRKDNSDALPEELKERIERHREGVKTSPPVEV